MTRLPSSLSFRVASLLPHGRHCLLKHCLVEHCPPGALSTGGTVHRGHCLPGALPAEVPPTEAASPGRDGPGRRRDNEGMEFGVAIFATHDAIRPADVAVLAEQRGHESLFFPEHTHMPAEHTPHYRMKDLPRRYSHTFDLFVAVTAAVTVTTRLRVGSGVCLLTQRDPITTAKEVASVDYLSG